MLLKNCFKNVIFEESVRNQLCLLIMKNIQNNDVAIIIKTALNIL